MALWGTNSSDETKPTWLRGDDLTNCFATAQGWVLRHLKGGGRYWDEVLVSIGGLGVALGNSNISAIYFANTIASYVQSSANAFVAVSFNEPITVTGTPTLVVDGATTDATASYISGSGTNNLLFKFTVPAVTQTLTLTAASISLAGGTLKDAANTDAVLSWTSSEVKKVQNKATGNTVVSVA